MNRIPLCHLVPQLFGSKSQVVGAVPVDGFKLSSIMGPGATNLGTGGEETGPDRVSIRT